MRHMHRSLSPNYTTSPASASNAIFIPAISALDMSRTRPRAIVPDRLQRHENWNPTSQFSSSVHIEIVFLRRLKASLFKHTSINSVDQQKAALQKRHSIFKRTAYHRNEILGKYSDRAWHPHFLHYFFDTRQVLQYVSTVLQNSSGVSRWPCGRRC